ncbi:MAG: PDZ domain-containing protein [Phycisphaerae bacterium]|nr:PDZ domain-containing protein [Phycisphaerae bacterium]
MHATRFITTLATLIALTACAARPARHVEPPMTQDQRDLAVQSFDVMWTTIRDRHFDPKLNGVDWEAVRTEFRPLVEAATTHAETVALMNKAIHRLGQSHFGIISKDTYEDVAGSAPGEKSRGAQGEVGLDTRVIDNELVVIRVDPGSPADRAGIRPGWTILEQDGRSIKEALQRLDKQYAQNPKRDSLRSLAMRHAVTGTVGETMKLRVADGKGRRRTIPLEIVPMSGDPVVFGHLPPMHLERDARRLDSGAGYMRFSVFFDPATLMPWFREHIAEYADAPGIIIDLRGNPGGIGGMAIGMGNMLVSEPNQKLGTLTTRETTLNFVFTPQAGRYTGPLAILVDETSASTSEFMAGGLQAIGRARVFGLSTAGMALPSLVIRLPSGDGLQYATANYVSADGKALEGAGVQPDELIPHDKASLLAGRDTMIDAAEAWIRSKSNKKTD